MVISSAPRPGYDDVRVWGWGVLDKMPLIGAFPLTSNSQAPVQGGMPGGWADSEYPGEKLYPGFQCPVWALLY
jgi:hypothetical protein